MSTRVQTDNCPSASRTFAGNVSCVCVWCSLGKSAVLRFCGMGFWWFFGEKSYVVIGLLLEIDSIGVESQFSGLNGIDIVQMHTGKYPDNCDKILFLDLHIPCRNIFLNIWRLGEVEAQFFSLSCDKNEFPQKRGRQTER